MAWYSAARSAAARRSRPQTAVSSAPSVQARAGACVTRAQYPVPTRPNLIPPTVEHTGAPCPASLPGLVPRLEAAGALTEARIKAPDALRQDGVMQPRDFSLYGAVDLGARQAAAQRRQQTAESAGSAAPSDG